MVLSGRYVDLVQPMFFDPTDLLLGGSTGKTKSFYRLCEYLEELGNDAAVSHVLFDLSDAQLIINTAQLDELARCIEALKDKGKRTIAWLENADNVHLAIATQCDDILMADFGMIDMPSASLQSAFYRDAMDLVGVHASVVRAGDFKGAVEPYLNSEMSSHLREHYEKMLESINAAQVSRLVRGRGLTTAEVRKLQQTRLLLPNAAVSAGIVTKLAPYGSMKESVQALVGDQVDWTTPKSKPKHEMSFFELMGKLMGGDQNSNTSLKEDSIVVLHMDGAIEDGKKESPGSIVSGPMVNVIESLAADDKVKGVVVRINSPGGSATASEAIRQALRELADKKPVVFSMGELAASGGYWITCIGCPIYAEHGTITGSIGVFTMKISTGTLLRRIGVRLQSVAIDESASMDSVERGWSEAEQAKFQEFVDRVYDKFLALASESRKLPIDKLKGIAGGRVWSGEQAKQLGLIDEIGGLHECIRLVAKQSGVEKYKTVHRPVPTEGLGFLSIFEEPDEDAVSIDKNLVSSLIGQLSAMGFKLDGLRAILRSSSSGNRTPTIWALMPAELSVR